MKADSKLGREERLAPHGGPAGLNATWVGLLAGLGSDVIVGPRRLGGA
jgi:hypothetical protein